MGKVLFLGMLCGALCAQAAESLIEEQLEEIGRIPHREIISVQRNYTKKAWRHELSPFTFGGIPFGTIRRTLIGGTGYALHWNDWFATEANFLYTKNFFTSFTEDINGPDEDNPVNTPPIQPLVQNLVFVLSAGASFTPWHGKVATFSRHTLYLEPVFSLGAGIAKTDSNTYFTFYPGIGLRVFFREWVSLKLEVRDYIYQEVSGTPGSEVTSLTNNYSVAVSLSFWLPKMPR